MSVKRSEITTALFKLLASSYNWATADPRLKVPDDLTGFQLPAMFLAKAAEDVSQATFGLTKHHFRYFALLVLRADGTPEDVSAESILDDMLDKIEVAFHPGGSVSPRGPILPQTLGGLVENCWIDGRVEIDSPVLFETCAVWVPISVLPRGGTMKVTT